MHDACISGIYDERSSTCLQPAAGPSLYGAGVYRFDFIDSTGANNYESYALSNYSPTTHYAASSRYSASFPQAPALSPASGSYSSYISPYVATPYPPADLSAYSAFNLAAAGKTDSTMQEFLEDKTA